MADNHSQSNHSSKPGNFVSWVLPLIVILVSLVLMISFT